MDILGGSARVRMISANREGIISIREVGSLGLARLLNLLIVDFFNAH